MSLPILDISDSNLQLWQGEEALRSPGYALLDGKQYRFGNPARAAARLRPRDINTRFWWQLNTEPLQPALGPARHSADMVHAHLLDIHEQAGKPGEMLLAVSGSMQRNQLALLLGIVQACPFEAVGMVHRSVAVGSLHGGSGRLFHLEIQLHQAVLTELDGSQDNLTLGTTTPLPGCGLLQLQEQLVRTIADAFIRQTRFDPRRKADSEQSLYDGLPDSLRTLASSGTAECNLEVNGYRARINRADLEKAGERLFSGLSETIGPAGAGDRVLLDPITSLLPGLRQRVPGAVQLPNDALARAICRHGDLLVQREQALNFVTSLPWLETSADTAATEPAVSEPEPAPAPAARQPTHLLSGSSARSLGDAGTALAPDCELFRSDGGWLLRGAGLAQALVNGSPYRQGMPLACGDTIAVAGGNSLTLIEVLP